MEGLNALGIFLLCFLFPYATASSAFSTKANPLVKEVGMDIISSAFVVLNLFNVV